MHYCYTITLHGTRKLHDKIRAQKTIKPTAESKQGRFLEHIFATVLDLSQPFDFSNALNE